MRTEILAELMEHTEQRPFRRGEYPLGILFLFFGGEIGPEILPRASDSDVGEVQWRGICQ